ncbi:hypothetical protein QBC35DRAFT_476197 [Podospora australis]|uniref:Uncharacterized protein n=1 Tax=Podospora australis TaxID=1536484 RepID=A0AAN6WSM3_9PEZI|nr:hypothetical protein QBC35DRAFT_476197 [Podospora australis]
MVPSLITCYLVPSLATWAHGAICRTCPKVHFCREVYPTFLICKTRRAAKGEPEVLGNYLGKSLPLSFSSLVTNLCEPSHTQSCTMSWRTLRASSSTTKEFSQRMSLMRHSTRRSGACSMTDLEDIQGRRRASNQFESKAEEELQNSTGELSEDYGKHYSWCEASTAQFSQVKKEATDLLQEVDLVRGKVRLEELDGLREKCKSLANAVELLAKNAL